MTVITEIAQTWLSLGASKDLLKLAQETYDSQSESLKLIQQSYELGASSMLEVQQAMQTVGNGQGRRRPGFSFGGTVPQCIGYARGHQGSGRTRT